MGSKCPPHLCFEECCPALLCCLMFVRPPTRKRRTKKILQPVCRIFSYARVQTMFLSTANIIWRHSDTFAVFLSTAR